MSLLLGINTSNYTTSVAVLDFPAGFSSASIVHRMVSIANAAGIAVLTCVKEHGYE